MVGQSTSMREHIPVERSEQPSSTSIAPDPSDFAAWRSSLLSAAAGGLCWAAVLGLMVAGSLDSETAVFAPIRVIFYMLTLGAGILTFGPLQRRLGLPGLLRQGVGGTFLLVYVVAFVPPPTGWLLSLPDLPVYLMLTAALFWSVSAIAMPLVVVIGKRLFRQRARQYDLRRARRQAHEIGLFAGLCVLLASLRVLTFVGVVLVLLILIVGEMLFLSFVGADT